MRQRKTVILVVALLALLVFGAWQLSMLRTKQQASALVAVDLPIILHHVVQGGVHSYSGAVSLPNACDTLSNGISTQGVNPSHITIHLSQGSVPCSTATKTQAGFMVSFSGAGEAPIVDAVILNGMEIPYTLVEAR